MSRIDPFAVELYGGAKFERPETIWSHGFPMEGANYPRVSLSIPKTSSGSAMGYEYLHGVAVPSRGCASCGWKQVRHGGSMLVPTGPFYPSVKASEVVRPIIYTMRWGSPWWLEECAPTLDGWCDRHGLELRVVAEWDQSYPSPKFAFVDMLQEFLETKHEWMMYVDADVVVHPLAPLPPRMGSGIHAAVDKLQKNKGRDVWVKWSVENLREAPSKSWQYRNAGVWLCDRDAAKKILDEISEPYFEGIMEQHHWNWWLDRAERNRGLKVGHLPVEWNRVPDAVGAGWFVHIYGKNKERALLRFREKGFLPDAVKRLAKEPSVPDFGEKAIVWPWASTKAEWDELWFSQRSVMQHWKEEGWKMVLLGDRRPAWWIGEFVKCIEYEHALWVGTHCAEKILWMNDDIFMIQDQTTEDLKVVPGVSRMESRLGRTMAAGNAWRRGLGQVLMRLHHHGKPAVNYSTHTPYLYDRERVDEIFQRFGIFWKMPFETAYHGWYETPWDDMLARKAKSPHDLKGKCWINPAFAQVSQSFRREMARRFGEPPV